MGLCVGVAALAPASIRILARLEPSHRAPDHRVVDADPDRLERAKDRPRSVEVVHAPSSAPGSVRRLGPAKEREAALDRRIVPPDSEPPESLDAPRGEVFSGRVEERSVVGKRDVVEEEARLVGVERRPTAILALHPSEPSPRTLDGETPTGVVGAVDLK